MDGLYIPGSSFKGAWRAYTESILRTLQAQPGFRHDLACEPLAEEDRCLTKERIQQIKNPANPPAADSDPLRKQARIDAALRQASCRVCRVFGNGQLAAKVLIKDLTVKPETFYRTEVRDGVAIDRDSGRAKSGALYQFEAVPAGAHFRVEIVVENGSPAELGLVMLGIRAFERGDVLLGGAKSRGLGWCRLESDWGRSEYITAVNLLTYLLRPADAAATGLPDTTIAGWLNEFQAEITGQE